MADIIRKKHNALAILDTTAIRSAVCDELDELNRIASLERERAALLKTTAISGKDLNNRSVMENRFGKEDLAEFRKRHSHLQKVFSKVQSLNGISRELLNHSLNFIRQNIGILTDGGNRRLVDRKA